MINTSNIGRALAVVEGGGACEDDGVVISVAPLGAASAPRRPMSDVLPERSYRPKQNSHKTLTAAQRIAIAEALRDGLLELSDGSSDDESDIAPAPPRLPACRSERRAQFDRGHARRMKADYEAHSSSEFRLQGSGKMVVLPSRTEPERVFVAGCSGSGKSCFAASYMIEYLTMFPKRKIYLFSTHEDEKAYQRIDLHAVPLDDEFTAEPLTLTDLENSLCVFDDTDALQNKKLAAAVDALNLDLINNGRKYNIHIVTLAHVLMGYAKTRSQLMEASRVVFFPGGNDYHAKRWMKVYGGVPDEMQRKILNERSRWVCVDMRQPRSYVTENAVVLLAPTREAP